MNVDIIFSFFASNVMLLRAAIIAIVGFSLLYIVVRLVKHRTAAYIQPHMQLLLYKLMWYGGLLLLGFIVLSELRVNVSALIGAAGIVGVAVGFASQTSISNIISGIFLLIEHPFKVGDFIETDKVKGFVQSIDLLAVQLKTSDGRCVRVPNECLIKNAVTNNTFYKVRRLTIMVTVDYSSDIACAIQETQTLLDQSDVIKKQQGCSIGFESVSAQTVVLCVQCWVDARKVITSRAMIVQALHALYTEKRIKAWVDTPYTQHTVIGAVSCAQGKDN